MDIKALKQIGKETPTKVMKFAKKPAFNRYDLELPDYIIDSVSGRKHRVVDFDSKRDYRPIHPGGGTYMDPTSKWLTERGRRLDVVINNRIKAGLPNSTSRMDGNITELNMNHVSKYLAANGSKENKPASKIKQKDLEMPKTVISVYDPKKELVTIKSVDHEGLVRGIDSKGVERTYGANEVKDAKTGKLVSEIIVNRVVAGEKIHGSGPDKWTRDERGRFA